MHFCVHSFISCERWFALLSFRSSIKVELLLLPLWVYPIWVFIMYCLTAPELCLKHRSASQIWHLGWGPSLLPTRLHTTTVVHKVTGCIRPCPYLTLATGSWTTCMEFKQHNQVWWLCHYQVVGWSSVKSQVWSCCRCRVHSCVY